MWLLSHKPVQRPFTNSVGCFHHFHHQLGNRLPFRFWVASQKLCFFISCTQRASNDISFHIFTYKGNDCVAIDVVISYAKYSTPLSFFARVVDLRLARNIHSHYVRKTLFVRMPFSFRPNWAPRVLSMVECEHYEQNERGYFSVWISFVLPLPCCIHILFLDILRVYSDCMFPCWTSHANTFCIQQNLLSSLLCSCEYTIFTTC